MAERKKNTLANMKNSVTSRVNVFTDIYVAMAEGEFSRFTVPHRPVPAGIGLRDTRLNLQRYLAETQHQVGCETIRADYAIREAEGGAD